MWLAGARPQLFSAFSASAHSPAHLQRSEGPVSQSGPSAGSWQQEAEVADKAAPWAMLVFLVRILLISAARAVKKCDVRCLALGNCVADTGECQCQWGWEGDACEVRMTNG